LQPLKPVEAQHGLGLGIWPWNSPSLYLLCLCVLSDLGSLCKCNPFDFNFQDACIQHFSAVDSLRPYSPDVDYLFKKQMVTLADRTT